MMYHRTQSQVGNVHVRAQPRSAPIVSLWKTEHTLTRVLRLLERSELFKTGYGK